MSEVQGSPKKARLKTGPIIVLVVLIALAGLLCVALAGLAIRAGLGAGVARRLGEGLAQRPAVQLVLGRLGLGRSALNARGQQLLEEGAAREQEGKVVEALQLYRQAQEAMPGAVEPYLALASAHETLGERDEAMGQLERAVEIDPAHAGARRELGRLYCLSGAYERCIEALQVAIELEPGDGRGHYWLGLAYQQGARGRFAEAERAYLRALQLEPDSAKAHLALGTLYQSQPGMEAQALEQIDEALRLAVQAGDAETEAKARAERARYYYAQDNYDLCVEEWQKVLQQRPEDEEALRRLGLCFAMRGNAGDLERAIAALERALVLDFGQLDAYYFYLGQYYASQEEYTRAFFAWDQFMRFSDDEQLKADVRSWLEAYRDAIQEERAP